mmetsp:Transcript_23067/g.33033  ORF Transcript_23067/g.33033 Transcript_23067/m.33033 type:complete len:107 (+) Transcript_23067:186-506(+)
MECWTNWKCEYSCLLHSTHSDFASHAGDAFEGKTNRPNFYRWRCRCKFKDIVRTCPFLQIIPSVSDATGRKWIVMIILIVSAVLLLLLELRTFLLTRLKILLNSVP